MIRNHVSLQVTGNTTGRPSKSDHSLRTRIQDGTTQASRTAEVERTGGRAKGRADSEEGRWNDGRGTAERCSDSLGEWPFPRPSCV